MPLCPAFTFVTVSIFPCSYEFFMSICPDVAFCYFSWMHCALRNVHLPLHNEILSSCSLLRIRLDKHLDLSSSGQKCEFLFLLIGFSVSGPKNMTILKDLEPGALCVLDQWGSVRSHVLSEQSRGFDSWLQS